jgi:hypothetical protein
MAQFVPLAILQLADFPEFVFSLAHRTVGSPTAGAGTCLTGGPSR